MSITELEMMTDLFYKYVEMRCMTPEKRNNIERFMQHNVVLLQDALNSKNLKTVFEIINNCGPKLDVVNYTVINNPTENEINQIVNHNSNCYQDRLYHRQYEAADSGKRDFFTKLFSWSIPTREIFEFIVNRIQCCTIISIGSGLGLNEAILKLYGYTVISTDLSVKSYATETATTFTNIIIADHLTAVTNNQDAEALFISWPIIVDDKVIKQYNGKYIIYIGETSGGCCAGEDFFSSILKKYYLTSAMCIKTWYKIHDRILLFTKK